MKLIEFLGESLDRIREFPADPRRKVGFQLDKVQRGIAPDDFKPVPAAGAGVEEIRVRDVSGAYRVIYLARLKDAVYVLHAFKKKSRRTARADIKIARLRLAELLRRRSAG